MTLDDAPHGYSEPVFTGIVQAIGRVEAISQPVPGRSVRLAVSTGGWTHRPTPGDSISINGCCLTVVPPSGRARSILHFDVVEETLRLTTLGRLKPGSRINLEHAARADTLMGGHLVQGHIDGVATVNAVQQAADWRVRVALPRPGDPASDASAGDLAQYIIPKGSVCLDGVALTVASIWKDGRTGERGFEVALIPATLRLTTLADLKRGDGVNLEVDSMAKTAVYWLRNFAGPPKPARNGEGARGRGGARAGTRD